MIEGTGKSLLDFRKRKASSLNFLHHPSDPKILLALELGLITLFIPEFKKIEKFG